MADPITIALINVGDRPNDGSGDATRVAHQKTNDNVLALKAGVEAAHALVGGVSDALPSAVEAAVATAVAEQQATIEGKLDLSGDNLPADPSTLRKKLRASQILSVGAFALIATATFDADVQMIRTGGYYAFGDEGGAQYRRSATDPGYPSYCQAQDANGVWWYLAVNIPRSRALGCRPNEEAFDCAPMLNAGIEYVTKRCKGGYIDLSLGDHHTYSEIRSIYEGIYFRGHGKLKEDWFAASTNAGITFPTLRSDGVMEMPSSIVGHHATGDVIRFTRSNCGVSGFKITSAASRWNAASTTLQLRGNGVRWETEDTDTAQRCNNPYLRDMVCESQPGVGWIVSCDSVNGSFERFNTSANKFAGWVLDNGRYTGRTHLGPDGSARIGIQEVRLFRSHDNGGEAFVVGHPSAGIYIPYRINVRNGDCGRNNLISTRSGGVTTSNTCEVQSIKNTWLDPQCMFHCEQGTVDNCGFGGTARVQLAWWANGIHVSGRDVVLNNCRYIECNVPIICIGRAGLQTSGVRVILGTISAVYADRPYFIQFDNTLGSIKDVLIDVVNASGVEAWTSTSLNVLSGLVIRGSAHEAEFTLADDAAVYYEFDQPIRGTVSLNGNASGQIYYEGRFRTGDSNAFVTSLPNTLASPAVVSSGFGTQGPMYGADGVDGEFRVQADQNSNRLYIRNRSGSARSFCARFSHLQSNVRAANVFGPFPAIVQITSPGNVTTTVGVFMAKKPACIGGYGARTFSISGSLPAGLSFDTATGLIFGTPTAPFTSATRTITVTDASGNATTASFTVSAAA